MYSYSVKNSLIFSEFSEEKQKEYFDFKQKSFLGHIDTLYYTVHLDCANWNEAKNKNLIRYLNECRNSADNLCESVSVFRGVSDSLVMRPFFHFKHYCYSISYKDMFDIFICDISPNLNTPPIFVQLRSHALWLDGVKNTFDFSFDIVKKIFSHYGHNVSKVRENRIDYAFHNNYIQDIIHFFPEESLADMQISDFKRWGKDGAIRWHKEGAFEQGEVEADYFTLGRRKSNNVFFRVYNKCKEVIEMGYKQFFIPLWLEKGLINKYDMYVLEKSFIHHTWSYIYKARCEFYYDYGSNNELKHEIYDMLNNSDTPVSAYKKIAEECTPNITIVTNVEFQTKRKFYDRLPVEILSDIINSDNYMHAFFEQVPSLINFLTYDTLRFVSYKGKFAEVRRSDRPVADWWTRLRSCKSLELDSDLHFDYYREYQFNLNAARSKYMTLNKIAGHSAYMLLQRDSDTDSSTLYNDVQDYLASLNDNDLEHYYRARSEKFKDKKKKLEKIGVENDSTAVSL